MKNIFLKKNTRTGNPEGQEKTKKTYEENLSC
jgi:hypothetical protein